MPSMVRHPIPVLALWFALNAATPADGFEASDAATFGFVAIGLWVARRALRHRFHRDRASETERD